MEELSLHFSCGLWAQWQSCSQKISLEVTMTFWGLLLLFHEKSPLGGFGVWTQKRFWWCCFCCEAQLSVTGHCINSQHPTCAHRHVQVFLASPSTGEILADCVTQTREECDWFAYFRGLSLHFSSFWFLFFVKEMTDEPFSLSLLLALCIGKHQNCMGHGVEKKFPWTNRKFTAVENWYLMLHHRRVAVWGCLCCHITNPFIPSIPCLTLFFQCWKVFPGPVCCQNQRAGCTIVLGVSSPKLDPCKDQVGWHPTSDSGHNWSFCEQTAHLTPISKSSTLNLSPEGWLSLPWAHQQWEQTNFFIPSCVSKHTPHLKYPQGLSFRLEALSCQSRSGLGRLEAWFLNEAAFEG